MTENERLTINGKEITLYREVETNLYRFSKDAVDMLLEALEEREQYRAIGTVEELQALKEKDKPKKPLFSTVHGDSAYHCSSCKKFVGFYDTRMYEYCHNCGQKLDWNS